MAGTRKPLPPDPPQETKTPIKLNDEKFPVHMFSPNAGIEQALIRAVDASKATTEIAIVPGLTSTYEAAVTPHLLQQGLRRSSPRT